MIGWESDDNVVGPIAAAAKQSLLRLIPDFLPFEDRNHNQSLLYRLVLEHGDFGVHNMSIKMNTDGQPIMTSVFDWETAHIVPAILSNPAMAVAVDLVTDKDAKPSVTRMGDVESAEDLAQYATWAQDYFKVRPLAMHQ